MLLQSVCHVHLHSPSVTVRADRAVRIQYLSLSRRIYGAPGLKEAEEEAIKAFRHAIVASEVEVGVKPFFVASTFTHSDVCVQFSHKLPCVSSSNVNY